MDSSRLVAASLLLLITTSLAAVISNPAQPCVPGQCKPPNCRCAGVDIPGGLTPSKTPQIVLISFDDGLRTQDYEGFYASVFNGRKNPNGCQIGLTFFASHYYTNYALLEDINKQGIYWRDHGHEGDPLHVGKRFLKFSAWFSGSFPRNQRG
ncbi:hypothetical protein EMCRGX_G024073 [Ephydatia muelleri]